MQAFAGDPLCADACMNSFEKCIYWFAYVKDDLKKENVPNWLRKLSNELKFNRYDR